MTTGVQHRLDGIARSLPSRDGPLSPPHHAGYEGGRSDPRAQPGLRGRAGVNPGAREGAEAMAETTIGPPASTAAQIWAWIRRGQREVSARIHAAGDDRARRHGWTVTATTGRFGFEGRSYRDPRFDERRRLLARQAVALGTCRDAASGREAGE
jgi:hypothetical protein